MLSGLFLLFFFSGILDAAPVSHNLQETKSYWQEKASHSSNGGEVIDWEELDKQLAGQHFSHNAMLDVRSQLPSHADRHDFASGQNLLKLDTSKLIKEVNQQHRPYGIYASHVIQADIESNDKGKAKKLKPSRRERYAGHSWQDKLQIQDQEAIYKALSEHWGVYDKVKFRCGYKNVRRLMDIKTARLILANDKNTILDMARKTRSLDPLRPISIKYWPNVEVTSNSKKDIMDRLKTRWGSTKQTTRDRLVKYYSPDLKQSLLSSNVDEFAKAADYMNQMAEIGKRTGGRRKYLTQ